MRSLPIVVMLLVAASLGAAEAYRWVDKDGVVHYSDKPAAGAERIPLNSAPKPGSVTQIVIPSNPRPVSSDVPYSACLVTSPASDQTFGIADVVALVVETQPVLQSGDRLSVTLNGSIIQDWPTGGTTHQVSGLPRGTYTLLVVVIGSTGTVKCSTAPVRFNVFQPSLLSPGRKPAPR